jgi:integrase
MPQQGLTLDKFQLNPTLPCQQKLMRHSDIRTTMNIYGDVVTDQESQAHGKVVGLALSA